MWIGSLSIFSIKASFIENKTPLLPRALILSVDFNIFSLGSMIK
jgi:hypothetical protein